jgi:uncharacterized membrane protein
MAQPLHVMSGATGTLEAPAVRSIGPADLGEALARGWDDFTAMPSHAVFLCLIYPLIGVVLALFTLEQNLLPLLYPLAAGFALLGPVAAIGLYEMSRRREQGQPAEWTHAFDVTRGPSFPAIMALGLILMLIFLAWLWSARAIYEALFGVLAPTSIWEFGREVFTTQAGWSLILWGNLVGLLFAVTVLTISVVSFPLLVDRDAGLAGAVVTSVRAVVKNPITMALWGLIVMALLALGTLPVFIGLAVVLPWLGHATWHLYRKVVVA